MSREPSRHGGPGTGPRQGVPSLPETRLRALLTAWRSAGQVPRGRPTTDSEPGPAELDKLARAALRLQRGLTGDRLLVGASYMDDPELLGAYLLYYWPVSYAQAARALSLAGLRPLRVLDLGSGPGPVSAAAVDAGAREAFLVDRSGPALDVARSLLGSAVVGTAVADLEDASIPYGGGWDLAAFGHCLNELGAGLPDRVERRAAVVERVGAALAPGGCVLVVEPATLASSRDTLGLRELLLSRGWTVTAPCTTGSPCPALAAGEGQSCHDESYWTVPRVTANIAARAGLDRDLIKATWLVLAPPAPDASKKPATDAAAGSSAAYRVVSEPLLNKSGRVRRLVCGPRGRFPLSAPSGDPMATRAGFFDLDRYELVTVEDPEARKGGWGVGSETRITRLCLRGEPDATPDGHPDGGQAAR